MRKSDIQLFSSENGNIFLRHTSNHTELWIEDAPDIVYGDVNYACMLIKEEDLQVLVFNILKLYPNAFLPPIGTTLESIISGYGGYGGQELIVIGYDDKYMELQGKNQYGSKETYICDRKVWQEQLRIISFPKGDRSNEED